MSSNLALWNLIHSSSSGIHTVKAFVCLSQVASAARWDGECVWTVLVEASPQIRAVLTVTALWAGLQRGTVQWMCSIVLNLVGSHYTKYHQWRLSSESSWNRCVLSISSGESFSGWPDWSVIGAVWHWGLCGPGRSPTWGTENLGGQSSGQNISNLRPGLIQSTTFSLIAQLLVFFFAG